MSPPRRGLFGGGNEEDEEENEDGEDEDDEEREAMALSMGVNRADEQRRARERDLMFQIMMGNMVAARQNDTERLEEEMLQKALEESRRTADASQAEDDLTYEQLLQLEQN